MAQFKSEEGRARGGDRKMRGAQAWLPADADCLEVAGANRSVLIIFPPLCDVICDTGLAEQAMTF